MAQPILVQNMPQTKRKLRVPKHSFAVRHRPYAITPFCIAPVIPGETLKGFTFQSRAVGDPMKSPLVGAHLEHYFFYVKFRDMEAAVSTALQEMMVNPARAMTDIDDTSTSVDWYHAGTAGNINYVLECYKVIVAWWFRNDGEAWNNKLIGTYAAAQIPSNSWLDNIMTDTAAAAIDFNVDLNADATIKASEVDRSLEQYHILRMQGLTVQTYEEFLMTYGVSLPSAEVNKPELLRYTKQWVYPSNTVEPTTGVPNSALSWSVQERADKDRYFKEPGFIVGLTCCRPKVYRSKQVGHAAALLNNVYAWLPATMRDRDPAVARRLIDNANAMLTGITNDYWVDFADLFLYGDQFVNFALTETDAGLIATPEASNNWQYPTLAMVEALFTNAAPKVYIRQDGIVTFQILGGVQEHFPFSGSGI